MYRKAMTITMFLVLAMSTAKAQSVAFFKNYRAITGLGGIGRSVARTSDGNIIFAGTDLIPGFGEVISVIKTNLSGDTLWVKHYGEPGKDMEAYSITQLNGGNILIAGSQTDTSLNAPEQALLAQISNAGALQWMKTYPRTGYGTVAHDLRVLNDGYAFCGTITDSATGIGDAWLVRIDLNGDTLWSRNYGGIDADDSWQIEKTPDGGFLLAGGSYSYRNGNAEDDAWIVKTDANGNQQWTNHYGNADIQDWIWSIAPAMVNGTLTGYVFTGVKNYNGSMNSDLFLAKVDTAGNLLWDKSMPGAAGFRQGFCIEPAGDNGFYVAASEFNAAYGFRLLTMKIDKDGNMVNSLLHGNQEVIRPRGMFINNLGDAFITGDRIAPAAGGSSFLARIRNIDSTGSPVSIIPVGPATASVSVYPNPATDHFTVTSTAGGIIQVVLTDMRGGVAAAVWGNGTWSQDIDLSGVRPGVYIVNIWTASTGNLPYTSTIVRLSVRK